LLILSAVLHAGVTHAEPLTREAAIRMALRENPQIAAARAREAAAEARAEQVDAARYPELSVTLGAGPALTARLVDGTAVQSTENAYGDVSLDDVSVVVGTQLDVVQPLYTFGKIGHRDEAVQHDKRARRAQTRMTATEVALEVARIYEGWFFAADAALFFDEVMHMLDTSINDTKEKLDAGEPDASERDLLQLQTAKSLAKLQLHRADANVRQAKAGLRAYLGLGRDSPLELPPGGQEPIGGEPGELTALLERARDSRPELTALSEGAKALSALAEAEGAGALPDLFAMGFLSAAYTPGRDLVDTRYVVDPMQHFVPGVLVGVRWNWQAGRADGRASERRAEASELERTRTWALSGIPAEVRKAFEDALRARADIAEAEKAHKRAKRWVIVALADQTVGLADSRAIVDAVEAYATMRVSYMDAKYRYNVAMAELAAATGTLDLKDGALYPGPASDSAASATSGGKHEQPEQSAQQSAQATQ
jgi:outer membrane protein TolC